MAHNTLCDKLFDIITKLLKLLHTAPCLYKGQIFDITPLVQLTFFNSIQFDNCCSKEQIMKQACDNH